MMVFVDRMLRNILEVKRDGVEVTGDERRLRNNELRDLYPHHILRVIKSRRMRWAGNVARMVEGRGAYRVLMGKPEGKREFGRSRCRWILILKFMFKK
jgi:hypothetical protein